MSLRHKRPASQLPVGQLPLSFGPGPATKRQRTKSMPLAQASNAPYTDASPSTRDQRTVGAMLAQRHGPGPSRKEPKQQRRSGSGSAFAACPICGKQVPLLCINTHLDTQCSGPLRGAGPAGAPATSILGCGALPASRTRLLPAAEPSEALRASAAATPSQRFTAVQRRLPADAAAAAAAGGPHQAAVESPRQRPAAADPVAASGVVAAHGLADGLACTAVGASVLGGGDSVEDDDGDDSRDGGDGGSGGDGGDSSDGGGDSGSGRNYDAAAGIARRLKGPEGGHLRLYGGGAIDCGGIHPDMAAPVPLLSPRGAAGEAQQVAPVRAGAGARSTPAAVPAAAAARRPSPCVITVIHAAAEAQVDTAAPTHTWLHGTGIATGSAPVGALQRLGGCASPQPSGSVQPPSCFPRELHQALRVEAVPQPGQRGLRPQAAEAAMGLAEAAEVPGAAEERQAPKAQAAAGAGLEEEEEEDGGPARCTAPQALGWRRQSSLDGGRQQPTYGRYCASRGCGSPADRAGHAELKRRASGCGRDSAADLDSARVELSPGPDCGLVEGEGVRRDGQRRGQGHEDHEPRGQKPTDMAVGSGTRASATAPGHATDARERAQPQVQAHGVAAAARLHPLFLPRATGQSGRPRAAAPQRSAATGDGNAAAGAGSGGGGWSMVGSGDSGNGDEAEALPPFRPIPHPSLEGQYLIPDFVSREEEAALIALCDSPAAKPPWGGAGARAGGGVGSSYDNATAQRTGTKRWGVLPDYHRRGVAPPQHPLPPLLLTLIERMRTRVPMLKDFRPNEANAIDYRRCWGSWLRPHADDRILSGDVIVNLSLVGAAVMTFGATPAASSASAGRAVRPGGGGGGRGAGSSGGGGVDGSADVRVLLPPRSLQVMSRAARYSRTHAIAPADLLDERRVSITFRRSELRPFER